MLSLKLLSATVILIFVLFIGGIEFESAHLARSQFFEDPDTNVTDTNSNDTDTHGNSSSEGSIVLLSQKLKKPSFGYRDLVGQVQNIGGDDAESVVIRFTAFDRDGGVIGTDYTYADVDTLKPDQKSTFKIMLNTEDVKGMDHYEISLDWSNSDGSKGYVENAQLYQSAPNPTDSRSNGETTQEKKIPNENPTTVPKSKKSYQLIIYLDNASSHNAIGGNFKILVYNSNNEPILSAKPNIDFNDDHQKISPPKGYPIIYQSGQYPKDISVCAQQERQMSNTTKLHDDCYPIKQNVQKTYWYTIFDYGEIDGSAVDSNSFAKSNEMAPAKVTLTPLIKSESNNQKAANMNGTEQVALKAQLKKSSLLTGWYDIKKFSLAVSDDSQICPSNNCKFSVENGKIFSLADSYRADGKLKVTVLEDGTSKSTLYPLGVTLDKTAEEESHGQKIETLSGTFEVGPHITYQVTNATLQVDKNSPVLTIQGERSASNSTNSE